MVGIQHIRDEAGARRLADLLNGTGRTRPVVVVTIPAGLTEPWIDAAEIAREAGPLCDVFLMPTGDFTWEFSNRMAAGTQVYGGAGRVYPVGHEWSSDLRKSPLRFAFNAVEGERTTQQLISDVLRMAAAAGMVGSTREAGQLRLRGTVTSTVAGRAFVDVGRTFPASIAEELTVADLPIDRIVQPDQVVEGPYDAGTNRLDVTASLRPGDEALGQYSAGDVVLSKVVGVDETLVELMLFPRTVTPAVTVRVEREAVTTNPVDDLRTLMTVGEVIPVRVVSVGPSWSLLLSDVDDDEPVLTAPALLPGGPPWLVEEEVGVEVEAAEPVTPPVPFAPSDPVVAHEPPQDEPPEDEAPQQRGGLSPEAPVRPTPALLDRRRPRATTPSSSAHTEAAGGPTRLLLLQIDALKAEVDRLRLAVTELRTDREDLLAQARDSAREREHLGYELKKAQQWADKQSQQLKAARTSTRKAKQAVSVSAAQEPRFADPEQGFRHLVLTRWAIRIEPGEQPQLPLPDYRVGPDFLESLDTVQGVKREKVADVVVEILTRRADNSAGRDLHQLRTGTGGDDPVRKRHDGAVAWRASLQTNSPSARRIHFWRLPAGDVELARVVTHDDFEI